PQVRISPSPKCWNGNWTRKFDAVTITAMATMKGQKGFSDFIFLTWVMEPVKAGKPALSIYQAAAAASSATFLAICFLSRRARCERSLELAFRRKLSSPPRCSTERSADAETRRRKLCPRASDIKVTSQRFGRKRRRVLLLAWLTLLPLITALPVSSQARDIFSTLSFGQTALTPCGRKITGSLVETLLP